MRINFRKHDFVILVSFRIISPHFAHLYHNNSIGTYHTGKGLEISAIIGDGEQKAVHVNET